MTTSPASLDRRADARDLIVGRVFTLTGQTASELAPIINPANGGLVLSGKRALESAGSVRRLLGDAPLLIEPKAMLNRYATAEDPFGLHVEGQLFPTGLGGMLDGQLEAGASIAITPTGFMPAGNADPLKAAVEQANALSRTDILLLMPVDARWCKEPGAKQLLAILQRSRHPVALTITGKSNNPWAEKGVLDTLHRLSAELHDLMLWRCDLTGLDAMAHGASAAAIGSIASLRRAFKPEEKGFRTDPKDQSPHVLVEQLLRYARGLHMHVRWFGNYPGISCSCLVCNGQAVDRFTETTMAAEAARHNQHTLNRIVDEMPTDPDARRAWWARLVESAVHQHAVLAAATKVRIEVPADLTSWSKREANAAAEAQATAGRPSR